jgi:hypothetical protein
VDLIAYLRVFVGPTTIRGSLGDVFATTASTDGWLAGGTGDFKASGDLDEVAHVRAHDILVPSGRWAIFDVMAIAGYAIDNGYVHYIFGGEPGYRIACPSLVLELSPVVQS